jgi:hypothetical protein
MRDISNHIRKDFELFETGWLQDDEEDTCSKEDGGGEQGKETADDLSLLQWAGEDRRLSYSHEGVNSKASSPCKGMHSALMVAQAVEKAEGGDKVHANKRTCKQPKQLGPLLQHVSQLSASADPQEVYHSRYAERFANDGCTKSFPLHSSVRVQREQKRAAQRQLQKQKKEQERQEQQKEAERLQPQELLDQQQSTGTVAEDHGGKEKATKEKVDSDDDENTISDKKDNIGNSEDEDEQKYSDSGDEDAASGVTAGSGAPQDGGDNDREEDEAAMWRLELGEQCAKARLRRHSNAGRDGSEMEQLKLRTGTASLMQISPTNNELKRTPCHCENDHMLIGFQTSHDRYVCDECDKEGIPEGATIRGCRECDFDLCSECFAAETDIFAPSCVQYVYASGSGDGVSLQERWQRNGELLGLGVPSLSDGYSAGRGQVVGMNCRYRRRRNPEEEHDALVEAFFKGDDVHPWTKVVRGAWACKRVAMTKGQLRTQLIQIFLAVMTAEAKADARRRELDRFARRRGSNSRRDSIKSTGGGEGNGCNSSSKAEHTSEKSDEKGDSTSHTNTQTADAGMAADKTTGKAVGGEDAALELIPSAVSGGGSERFGIADFVVEWTRKNHHRFAVVKKGKKGKHDKKGKQAADVPTKAITGHRGALRETVTGDLRVLNKSVKRHMKADDLVMLFARCCGLTSSKASIIDTDTLRPCLRALAQSISLSMQDASDASPQEAGATDNGRVPIASTDNGLSDGGTRYPWSVTGADPTLSSRSIRPFFTQHLEALATRPAPQDDTPPPGYRSYAPVSDRGAPPPKTVVDKDFVYEYSQKFNTFCTTEDFDGSAGGEAVSVAALLLLLADSAVRNSGEGETPILRKHKAKKKKRKGKGG